MYSKFILAVAVFGGFFSSAMAGNINMVNIPEITATIDSKDTGLELIGVEVEHGFKASGLINRSIEGIIGRGVMFRSTSDLKTNVVPINEIHQSGTQFTFTVPSIMRINNKLLFLQSGHNFFINVKLTFQSPDRSVFEFNQNISLNPDLGTVDSQVQDYINQFKNLEVFKSKNYNSEDIFAVKWNRYTYTLTKTSDSATNTDMDLSDRTLEPALLKCINTLAGSI